MRQASGSKGHRVSGRRFSPRLLASLMLVLLLPACARAGLEDLAPRPEEAVPDATILSVYAATTRSEASGFGGGAGLETSYFRFDVAVPPGLDKLTRGLPDLSDYRIMERERMPRDGWLRAVKAADVAAGEPTLGVFVHGYNMDFQKSVFRLAQIAADSDSRGVPVLFTWPSTGKATDYLQDRPAALFSRDGLAELLTDLASQGEVVTLFGHSMGGFVSGEALRTLGLQGRRDVLDRIDLVLAGPDMDLAVFAGQMRAIQHLHAPVVILTAADDRALATSARIWNGNTRLGALDATDPTIKALAEAYDLQLLDISAVEADPLGHQRFIRLAQVYSWRRDGPRDLTLPGAYVYDALTRHFVHLD